ncbi:unnamed protein product [Closterium sp. NIES-54]
MRKYLHSCIDSYPCQSVSSEAIPVVDHPFHLASPRPFPPSLRQSPPSLRRCPPSLRQCPPSLPQSPPYQQLPPSAPLPSRRLLSARLALAEYQRQAQIARPPRGQPHPRVH